MAGTSEAGTSRGTLNTPDGSAYDVFVSFRGPDTRYNITDVLYVFMKEKGIYVFRDTEEVRNGEAIGDELRRAVPDSRIYVVVFSKGYASSAWCLKELAMMVACLRDPASRKVILPIFYYVSPSDVKLQTNRYRKALRKHKEKYKKEDVKLWEEALEKVGGIRGLEYKKDMGMGEFVCDVVVDILNKLNIKDRCLPDHLVGMAYRVEYVVGMLNLSSRVERLVVMLHGMGGIGKTTLASVIFNRICSDFNGCCCFLADVRKSLSTDMLGVVRLQKKLLRDIFGKSDGKIGDSSDGRNEIKRRLHNRRVLVIFDDVTESSQLKSLVGNFDVFGPGTRIIVTTRDKSVCEGLVSPSVTAYEVEGMGPDHALQLFGRHAFRGEVPPADYVHLSNRFICKAGNLPLALEVIGGHLFGKEKHEWEHTLEMLARVPHKDVLSKLRISYDDLDKSEKQIFLDIACFDDTVMDKEYASYMWKACDFFPKRALDVLQNRSLIKVWNVDDDEDHAIVDKYWMHDLIREMGREIVNSESPGKRSRLWDPQLALNVIRQKQGTDQVFAVNLRGTCEVLAGKEFKGMSNLRFLNLYDGAELSGKFRNFLKNLLWLSWKVNKLDSIPNPNFFKMDSLVILQLQGPGITDNLMEGLRMGNLKVLVISNAEITRLPDLSRFPMLEIIILNCCWNLEEIPSSIGGLGYLKRLIILECFRFTKLPEELGFAKTLQELRLSKYSYILEWPESIGSLVDLRILHMSVSCIRKLPSWVGNLKSLEVLEISRLFLSFKISMSEVPILARCNLFGLASLRSLNLGSLDEDVEGIEKLYGLQKLSLDVDCILSTNLGSMSWLQDFSLSFCDISYASLLPSSLQRLSLWKCWQSMQSGTSPNGRGNMRNMICPIRLSNLGSLRRLCYLHLESCECVDFSGVERMVFLEELAVWRCGFAGEIPNLSNLSRLKRVKFMMCDSLISVPCMVGDCRLLVSSCGEFASFEGPYQQYPNKRKRRRTES